MWRACHSNMFNEVSMGRRNMKILSLSNSVQNISQNKQLLPKARLNLQFPNLNLADIIMQNTTDSHMHSDRRVSMTTLLSNFSSAVKSASIYTVIYLGKYGVETLRIIWH